MRRNVICVLGTVLLAAVYMFTGGQSGCGECTDVDGDGFAIEGGTCGPIDCDDGDASIHPDADEVCGNGTDDDCDGIADEGCPITIPAGTFTMGSDAGVTESPAHEVYLGEYTIDPYEVTNAEYEACVDAGPCMPPSTAGSETRPSYYGNPTYGDYPVLHVAWNQAVEYCEWVGRRLPTEAEWEKAARGADERVYPWGDSPLDCDHANYGSVPDEIDCNDDSVAIGTYPLGVSSYEVHNLQGNVMEWMADWHDENYYQYGVDCCTQGSSQYGDCTDISCDGQTVADPQGPVSGTYRVLRGGSYCYGCINAAITTYYRGLFPPTLDTPQVGFRCAGD